MTGTKPDRLKILMLSTSYPTRPGSNSGVFVSRLVQAISTIASEVSVVTPDDPVSQTSTGLVRARYAPKKFQVLAHSPGGVPVALRENKWLYFLVPSLLFSLYISTLKRAYSSDVLHANWAFSGAIGGLVKMISGIRLVTTLRGEDVKASMSRLNRFFLWITLRYSDAVVVVSKEMGDELALLYPAYSDKVSIINNGVGDEFITPGGKGRKREDSTMTLISVGSLISRKNHAYIFDALSSLQRGGTAFRWTIVGAGIEMEALQSMARFYGLEDSVIFSGEKSPREVAQLLHRNSIFISASKHEGRPNSVVEAMASGCCILLSDIPGHRELVNRSMGGYLFSLADVSELERVLKTLNEGGVDLCGKGDNARQFVIDSGLTWERCASAYVTNYLSVLSK